MPIIKNSILLIKKKQAQNVGSLMVIVIQNHLFNEIICFIFVREECRMEMREVCDAKCGEICNQEERWINIIQSANIILMHTKYEI